MPACSQCPGYLIQLPDVLNASRAASWKESGNLRDLLGDDGPTEVLCTYIDTLLSAVRQVERDAIRQMRERHGHNG